MLLTCFVLYRMIPQSPYPIPLLGTDNGILISYRCDFSNVIYIMFTVPSYLRKENYTCWSCCNDPHLKG